MKTLIAVSLFCFAACQHQDEALVEVSLDEATVPRAIAEYARSVSSAATSACQVMTTEQRLFAADMSSGDTQWPMRGGGGEFGGDWYVEAGVAKVDLASVTQRPSVTGIFWFFDVCPAGGGFYPLSGGSLSASFDADASGFTKPDSVASYTIYYFDASGKSVGYSYPRYPMYSPEQKTWSLSPLPIPANARRVAIAPMMNVAPGETGSASFANITVNYLPYADLFSIYMTDAFGSYGADMQPTGWTEADGDWLVDATANPHVVLWNPNWSQPTPRDKSMVSTLSKSFPVGNKRRIAPDILIAATFTDPESKVFVQLDFPGFPAASTTSDAISGSKWRWVSTQNFVPSGATTFSVTLHATLGPNEQSSFYADSMIISAGQ